MMKLLIASKNTGKIREFSALLAEWPVSFVSLAEWPEVAEPEETGATFSENACLKAAYYARATGLISLADDSGLAVDALAGAPGVRSARYAGHHGDDAANNRLVLAQLDAVPEAERTGRFLCALAVALPSGEIVASAEGACEGVVLRELRGAGGFGYDPLFWVPALGKTLAEATADEKNAVSHRGNALRSLAKQWQVIEHALRNHQ